MINWKKLHKRIPTQIKIKDQLFEIVWSTEIINDKHIMGMTRFDPNQIIIKIGQSPKETVHTYIHEVVHAIDYVYDIDLTEEQVLAIESSLSVILKQPL